MGQRLGQHFLKDKSKIILIADFAKIKSGEIVVEIGPGHGELTSELLKRGAIVYAIEKDEKLIKQLEYSFSEFIKKKEFIITIGDALKKLGAIVSRFKNGKYKIVGNIPYYITGYLLRIISELKNKPDDVVLLVQKEVGERICSKKGNMNLIGAAVQFWAEPCIVGIVKKGSFSPSPKVDSVILSLRKKNKMPEILPDKYYKFINIIFSHPRKTIKKNLILNGVEDVYIKEILDNFEYEYNIRAHQLSVEEIIHLSTSFISSYIL